MTFVSFHRLLEGGENRSGIASISFLQILDGLLDVSKDSEDEGILWA